MPLTKGPGLLLGVSLACVSKHVAPVDSLGYSRGNGIVESGLENQHDTAETTDTRGRGPTQDKAGVP